MTPVERARDFLRAVASGDTELARRQVDAGRYLDHDPAVARGGVEGLEALLQSRPTPSDLRVVRALEDGDLVVLQSRGERAGGMDHFDVFRFADGLIVERWLFSSPGGPPNRSGHTQLDGPTEPVRLEDTERSKLSRAHVVHSRGCSPWPAERPKA